MALNNALPAGSSVLDTLINNLAPIGARYAQKGSAQSVSNATDSKMRFETAVHTNTDVIASGASNTDFAIQRTGFWLIEAGVRFLGAAGGLERHLFLQTGSAFATANRIGQSVQVNVSTAPASPNCSALIKVTSVPLTIICGLFQNSGGPISLDVAFGEVNHISLTRLGPP